MKYIELNNTELIKSIINTIDCIRAEKGLSLNGLAEEAGLSSNTLKYIFKKKTCPSLLTLNCLCNALDIPLWQFFMLTTSSQNFFRNELQLLEYFEHLNESHKELIIYITKALSK